MQPLQPSKQQAGKQSPSEAQQQALPASTRQKKKPRVAFGRRVGVAVSRKPHDGDVAADFQESKQLACDLKFAAAKLPSSTIAAGNITFASRLEASSTIAAGNITSASRLEAIMEASRAMPVSARHTPAAGAKPASRQAQAAAGQNSAPSAQMQKAAAHAIQAGECMLHADITLPACGYAAPSLAAAQAQQSAGDQGGPEPAVAQHTWQVPYNRAAYADEDFQHPPASDTAVRTALHVTTDVTSAVEAPDGCKSAATLTAPGDPLKASSELPDSVRVSHAGLQKQYDTLLTDLAAQQQKAQVPAVRHSRLWDQQPPAASAMTAGHITQAVSTSSATSGGASFQSIKAGAPTADASTSPCPATATSFAHPASQVVVLPDDPFHQQLPQRLAPLPQHSQPQQHYSQQFSEPSELLNATPQDPAASQCRHTIAMSSAAHAQDVPSAAPAPQPSMPQHQEAQTQTRLRLEPEPPQAGAESTLSSPEASSALPGAAPHAPTVQGPADRPTHQACDSQSTSAEGRRPPDKKLLRASLAEWLADAVASKLWSAFEKQRQATTPVGALGSPCSCPGSSLALPGRKLLMQCCQSFLGGSINACSCLRHFA